MKLFTVEEANDALPHIIPRLGTIRALYDQIVDLKGSAAAASAASNFGGGMTGGSDYVKALYNIGRLTNGLQEEGIQLKDLRHGLIDFPCILNGRVVLLCWKLGESEVIAWWHELETGFAGRRRLQSD